MATVTKKQLIESIADKTSNPKATVRVILESLLAELRIELAEGNRIEFRDFGVFEPKIKAPRIAQNPKTLERLQVPARKTVKFKLGRAFQHSLDGAGADNGRAAPKPKAPRPGPPRA